MIEKRGNSPLKSPSRGSPERTLNGSSIQSSQPIPTPISSSSKKKSTKRKSITQEGRETPIFVPKSPPRNQFHTNPIIISDPTTIPTFPIPPPTTSTTTPVGLSSTKSLKTTHKDLSTITIGGPHRMTVTNGHPSVMSSSSIPITTSISTSTPPLAPPTSSSSLSSSSYDMIMNQMTNLRKDVDTRLIEQLKLEKRKMEMEHEKWVKEHELRQRELEIREKKDSALLEAITTLTSTLKNLQQNFRS